MESSPLDAQEVIYEFLFRGAFFAVILGTLGFWILFISWMTTKKALYHTWPKNSPLLSHARLSHSQMEDLLVEGKEFILENMPRLCLEMKWDMIQDLVCYLVITKSLIATLKLEIREAALLEFIGEYEVFITLQKATPKEEGEEN
jgi:uncharacterized membrane protein YraQ (UPF0718 family)